jgi:hypothetical protein
MMLMLSPGEIHRLLGEIDQRRFEESVPEKKKGGDTVKKSREEKVRLLPRPPARPAAAYRSSSLSRHSSRMQHHVIRCASLAAIDIILRALTRGRASPTLSPWVRSRPPSRQYPSHISYIDPWLQVMVQDVMHVCFTAYLSRLQQEEFNLQGLVNGVFQVFQDVSFDAFEVRAALHSALASSTLSRSTGTSRNFGHKCAVLMPLPLLLLLRRCL